MATVPYWVWVLIVIIVIIAIISFVGGSCAFELGDFQVGGGADK